MNKNIQALPPNDEQYGLHLVPTKSAKQLRGQRKANRKQAAQQARLVQQADKDAKRHTTIYLTSRRAATTTTSDNKEQQVAQVLQDTTSDSKKELVVHSLSYGVASHVANGAAAEDVKDRKREDVSDNKKAVQVKNDITAVSGVLECVSTGCRRPRMQGRQTCELHHCWGKDHEKLTNGDQSRVIQEFWDHHCLSSELKKLCHTCCLDRFAKKPCSFPFARCHELVDPLYWDAGVVSLLSTPDKKEEGTTTKEISGHLCWQHQLRRCCADGCTEHIYVWGVFKGGNDERDYASYMNDTVGCPKHCCTASLTPALAYSLDGKPMGCFCLRQSEVAKKKMKRHSSLLSSGAGDADTESKNGHLCGKHADVRSELKNEWTPRTDGRVPALRDSEYRDDGCGYIDAAGNHCRWTARHEYHSGGEPPTPPDKRRCNNHAYLATGSNQATALIPQCGYPTCHQACSTRVSEDQHSLQIVEACRDHLCDACGHNWTVARQTSKFIRVCVECASKTCGFQERGKEQGTCPDRVHPWLLDPTCRIWVWEDEVDNKDKKDEGNGKPRSRSWICPASFCYNHHAQRCADAGCSKVIHHPPVIGTTRARRKGGDEHDSFGQQQAVVIKQAVLDIACSEHSCQYHRNPCGSLLQQQSPQDEKKTPPSRCVMPRAHLGRWWSPTSNETNVCVKHTTSECTWGCKYSVQKPEQRIEDYHDYDYDCDNEDEHNLADGRDACNFREPVDAAQANWCKEHRCRTVFANGSRCTQPIPYNSRRMQVAECHRCAKFKQEKRGQTDDTGGSTDRFNRGHGRGGGREQPRLRR